MNPISVSDAPPFSELPKLEPEQLAGWARDLENDEGFKRYQHMADQKKGQLMRKLLDPETPEAELGRIKALYILAAEFADYVSNQAAQARKQLEEKQRKSVVT